METAIELQMKVVTMETVFKLMDATITALRWQDGHVWRTFMEIVTAQSLVEMEFEIKKKMKGVMMEIISHKMDALLNASRNMGIIAEEAMTLQWTNALKDQWLNLSR